MLPAMLLHLYLLHAFYLPYVPSALSSLYILIMLHLTFFSSATWVCLSCLCLLTCSACCLPFCHLPSLALSFARATNTCSLHGSPRPHTSIHPRSMGGCYWPCLLAAHACLTLPIASLSHAAFPFTCTCIFCLHIQHLPCCNCFCFILPCLYACLLLCISHAFRTWISSSAASIYTATTYVHAGFASAHHGFYIALRTHVCCGRNTCLPAAACRHLPAAALPAATCRAAAFAISLIL